MAQNETLTPEEGAFSDKTKSLRTLSLGGN